MGHYRRVLAQVPDNMIPNLKPSSALKEDITRVCGWVRPDNTEAGAKVEVVDTISPEKVAAAIAELEAGRYPDTVDEGTTSAPFYRKINCESSLRRINVCNQSEFRRASGLRLNEAKTMEEREARAIFALELGVIPVTTLVAQYDSGNDVSAEHHTALLTAWRRSGYAAMQMHLPRGTPSAIKKQATQTI
ncbi:hypothetical protein PC118_g15505 [Phytophthora cactorum]|uniref:Uncharacterized protein n=1 Tax=Phytophthora cactorum TaxID=29920 RepID=A0A8T1FL81_9STRA|nr:hypothetical protein PC118_g15505 [Phytophthora cactorum]